MKACDYCGSPAQVSICTIASTLGQRKRRQKNTTAVPVCRACLNGSQAWDGVAGLPGIKQRVNTAVEALTKQSAEQPQSTSGHFQMKDANTEARESAPALLSLPIRD